MRTDPVVYLHGEFIPAAEAHISIYDFGIVLGATITDLLRTFRQQPYRVDDHVRRFYESCKYARIAPPIAPEELAATTRELVRRNSQVLPPEGELAVVYFITPGANPVYAGSASSPSVTA